MPHCIFTRPAREDLRAITEYVKRENPQAAAAIYQAIEDRCRLAANFPNMGKRVDWLRANTRCLVVGMYLAFYRPIEDGIVILHIVHGAREIDADFFDK